jgi:NarL family two-component system response regulator LiaR
MDKRRLVIIDDHDLLRRGLAGALGKGWTLTGEAADIEEAKLLFENLPSPPNLVVLDIALRGGDWGLDLIPYLAARYGKPAVPPVLVYSVYADYSHVQAAMSMGVQGYISKEEGFPVLEKAIQTVLRGQVYVNQKIISKLSVVPGLLSSLTRREKEVFLMVQRGLGNHEIAGELGLVLRTVECYLNRIYSKLGIKSRKELQAL